MIFQKKKSLKKNSIALLFLFLTILLFPLISAMTIEFNSPADNNLSLVKTITLNTSCNISGTSLANVSLYDNSTGSWGVRNTSDIIDYVLSIPDASLKTIDEFNDNAVHAMWNTYDPLGEGSVTEEDSAFLRLFVSEAGSVALASDNDIFSSYGDYIKILSHSATDTAYSLSLVEGDATTPGDSVAITNLDAYEFIELFKINTTSVKWRANGSAWTIVDITSLSSAKLYFVLGSANNDDKNGRIDWIRYSDMTTNATSAFTREYNSGNNIKWNMLYCAINNTCEFATANRTFNMDYPNFTVYSPSSTITSGVISINATIDAVGDLSYCFYNITRGASTEKANTAVNCSQFTDTYTLSGVATYSLNIWANQSGGIGNYTNYTFTYSSATGGGGPSGGGSTNNDEDETEEEYVSVCIQFKDAFNQSLIEAKKKEKILDKLSIVWNKFWDYVFCSASASIVPI